MVIDTHSEGSDDNKQLSVNTHSEGANDNKQLSVYTHDEFDAAVGLLMLHSTEIYKTYQSLTLPIDSIDDIRSVSLEAHTEWETKMNDITVEAEAALEGSRYEKYVYKGQMARSLVPYAERSSQQRQRNNEASRRSRFLKSRKEFIKVRINQLTWQLDDNLDEQLHAIRSTCNVLESQVRNLGYNMDLFTDYWKNLEKDQYEYRETMLKKSRVAAKRKRESSD